MTSVSADLPSYLDLAAEALGKESERWAGEDTIGLHSAASELLGWVKDDRRFVRRFHLSAWRSVISEFQASQQHVGHSLKQVISPLLDELTKNLKSCLQGPEGQNRGLIEVDLERLIAQLQSSESLLACWQDFLRACKRPEFSIPKIARLRDDFWAVVAASRHNARELNGLLKGVLRDDSQNIYRVKLLLGEDTSMFPARLRERVRKPAGLNFGERERLCRQLIGKPPREAEHVVWFTFTSAQINTHVVQAGPVQLFNGPSLRDMSPDAADFPQEFRATDADYKRIFPEGDNFVLVRVNLGVRAVSDAASLARKQALAVLIAGSQHSSGRGGAWEESGSRIHVMDGRIVSQTFARISTPPVTSFQLDPLAHGIDRAARRIADHLPIESRTLAELLDALDLWDKAKRYDEASSLLVHVRLIESIASHTSDGDWVEFCNRVFKHHWVWDDLIWRLRNVMHDATYGTSMHINDEAFQVIEDMRRKIFRSKEGLLYSDMEAALDCLPQLSHLYPDRALVGYELRSVARDYSSCDRLNLTRKALISRWDRAMARLERVRNSLTHGGPVTDESLRSVSAFSRKLAGALIGCALDAALDGKRIAGVMDEMAERGAGWESRARASVTPQEFFFD
ncbi:hypothetical protein [Streptomyces ardesiacus]|uniref:hypothetical protein n=1 Tax=Streptomyces ardesiacus TaxID=285564 RepID=UPI00367C4B27